MKKIIEVVVIKKEVDENLARRREAYALIRDLQASEQNEAITKRLLSEEVKKAKCLRCSKEQIDDNNNENPESTD